MKVTHNRIYTILFLLLLNISFTFQIEDFSLFKMHRSLSPDNAGLNVTNHEKNRNSTASEANKATNTKNLRVTYKTISQSNKESSPNNSTIANSNNTASQGDTSKEIIILNSNSSMLNSSKCVEIKQILLSLVDLDNSISQLRESFLNHSKTYLEYSLHSNTTAEKNQTQKREFEKKENKIILNYINKINELSNIILEFKQKLSTLSQTDCPGADSKLANTEKNLENLLSLIKQEVKEINLPIAFVTITSRISHQ